MASAGIGCSGGFPVEWLRRAYRCKIWFFYVERGTLSVIDGSLVLNDAEDRTQYEVPARATTTILVGPGASVTNEAMRLASAYGVTRLWMGEHGGRPLGLHTDSLIAQCSPRERG